MLVATSTNPATRTPAVPALTKLHFKMLSVEDALIKYSQGAGIWLQFSLYSHVPETWRSRGDTQGDCHISLRVKHMQPFSSTWTALSISNYSIFISYYTFGPCPVEMIERDRFVHALLLFLMGFLFKEPSKFAHMHCNLQTRSADWRVVDSRLLHKDSTCSRSSERSTAAKIAGNNAAGIRGSSLPHCLERALLSLFMMTMPIPRYAAGYTTVSTSSITVYSSLPTEMTIYRLPRDSERGWSLEAP